MKPWLLIAPLVLAFAGTLHAQEGPSYRKLGDSYHELEVDLRWSMLGGDALEGTEWGDFFKDGVGLKLGVNQLWPVSKVIDLGVSVGLTYDTYSGAEYSEFDSGLGATLTFDQDQMNVIKFQGGGIMRVHFQPAWFDVRFAFGVAYYASVDTHMTGGGFDEHFEAIASTTTYAFDLGFRLGFDLSPTAALSIGVSFDLVAAPDAGSGFVPGTEFDFQDNAVFLVGGEFKL